MKLVALLRSNGFRIIKALRTREKEASLFSPSNIPVSTADTGSSRSEAETLSTLLGNF
jgi:hypothetical protein